MSNIESTESSIEDFSKRKMQEPATPVTVVDKATTANARAVGKGTPKSITGGKRGRPTTAQVEAARAQTVLDQPASPDTRDERLARAMQGYNKELSPWIMRASAVAANVQQSDLVTLTVVDGVVKAELSELGMMLALQGDGPQYLCEAYVRLQETERGARWLKKIDDVSIYGFLLLGSVAVFGHIMTCLALRGATRNTAPQHEDVTQPFGGGSSTATAPASVATTATPANEGTTIVELPVQEADPTAPVADPKVQAAFAAAAAATAVVPVPDLPSA